MKKIVCLLCALCLILNVCAFSFAEEESYEMPPVFESIDSLTSDTLTVYIGDENFSNDVEFWFVNGEVDIPFVSMDSLDVILEGFIYYTTESESADIDMSVPAENAWRFTRENGSSVIFDLANNLVVVDDINLFIAKVDAVNSLDVLRGASAYTGEDFNLLAGKNELFVKGNMLVYDLNAYGIPTVVKDGMGYVPLQLVSDLILSNANLCSLYNRNCVILTDSLKAGDPLYDLYYAAEPHTKSQALSYFNYYELCLGLDANYGLAQEHGITSFKDFFDRSGMSMRLINEDAADTWSCVIDLTTGYFGDGHSNARADSYMSVAEYDPGSIVINSSVLRMMQDTETFKNAREKYYPDGPVGYEEVGNTAYITFDSFVFDPTCDYYSREEFTNDPDNVFELIFYATKQIFRDDSPVENVVLDLTNNGGGMVDVAAGVVSWFLGSNGATLNVVNVKNGAQSEASYMFDADLDHRFTGADYLSSTDSTIKLYCLISGSSFSCGNLVPGVFKESGMVTLIGRTTGGGSNLVGSLTTADGCLFSISSPNRISTVKNGSFYGVDEGFEPDIYVNDPEHLYDRQYLTDFINNMF